MPNMRKSVIAILCSDLHLRHTPPSSRLERDWYEVMDRHLGWLRTESVLHDCPIICAGDVFDRWNPPAELVSWAIDHLPEMYAIPGNHDSHGHDYERRMDGAYGALVKAGIIQDLKSEEWTLLGPGHYRTPYIWVWANPWGRYSLPEDFCGDEGVVSLQVIHKYVYDSKAVAYKDAPESGLVDPTFTGSFDAVLSGDNHITWGTRGWLNPGSLMQLKRDQKDHVPTIGYLHSDAKITIVQNKDLQTKEWAEGSELHDVAVAAETLEAIADIYKETSFADRLFRAAENAAHEELSKILREVWEKCRE